MTWSRLVRARAVIINLSDLERRDVQVPCSVPGYLNLLSITS
jgi:hypothetical protein